MREKGLVTLTLAPLYFLLSLLVYACLGITVEPRYLLYWVARFKTSKARLSNLIAWKKFKSWPPINYKVQPQANLRCSTDQIRHLANHDESDIPTKSCPICISCTHWMLMGSAYTPSIRFAASPRTAPLRPLTILCRSKRARSQSQHIRPGSVQTTSTLVGPISPSVILERGEADRRDCAGHRVTLKKRYGLLLTQKSE